MGEGVIAYGVAGGLLVALLLVPALYGELPALYVDGWTTWGREAAWGGLALAGVATTVAGFLASRADGGGASRGALAGALAGGIAFAAVGAAASSVAAVAPLLIRLQEGGAVDAAFRHFLSDRVAAIVLLTTAAFWALVGGGGALGAIGGAVSRSPRRRLAVNPSEASAPLGMLILGVAVVPALAGSLSDMSELLAIVARRQGTDTWQAVAVQTAPLVSWLGILGFAVGWAWTIAGFWRHLDDGWLRRPAALLAILALTVPLLLAGAGWLAAGPVGMLPGLGLVVFTLLLALRAMRRPPPIHERVVDHSPGGAVAGALLAGLWWTIELAGGGVAAGVPLWLYVVPCLPALAGGDAALVDPVPVDAVQTIFRTTALFTASAAIGLTLFMAAVNASIATIARRGVTSA